MAAWDRAMYPAGTIGLLSETLWEPLPGRDVVARDWGPARRFARNHARSVSCALDRLHSRSEESRVQTEPAYRDIRGIPARPAVEATTSRTAPYLRNVQA